MSEVRNDWTREEIAALFDLPFMELVFRAAEVHRANHPHNEVQLSTLLSIKTGGCQEDCGYCSQSVKADSGVKATKLLGVQEVPKDRVSSYGVVKPVAVKERLWRADDLVEKPSVEEAPSRLAVLGRYIITPEIFEILEKTEPGRGGEIQLTDALKKLAEREPVFAYEFEGRRYDSGDKQGFLEATVDFALKRPELRDQFLRYLMKTVGRETGEQ